MKHTEKVINSVVAVERAPANALLVDIAILSGLAVVLSVTKMYDKANMQMPGITGIYWAAFMLLGRGYTNRNWAGSFIGGGAALAAFAVAPVAAIAATGMTIKFAVTGVVIDLLYPAFSRFSAKSFMQVFAWLLMGAAANGSKFIVHAIFKTLTAQHSNSLMRGFGSSLTYHLIFGAIGGIIAFGIYILMKKKQSDNNKL